jgi:hypothetical protein
VTRAPRRAAWVAAVFPAGPPPMIRNRVGTSSGYATAAHARTGTSRPGGPQGERTEATRLDFATVIDS